MIDITTILADGHISEEEVTSLRKEIYEDGVVSREEANALFELADKATTYCAEFEGLFVEAIYEHLSEDADLSEEEIAWLVEKINSDGRVSGLERRLLNEIAEGLPDGKLPDALAALIA